jgi:hypothetical protein
MKDAPLICLAEVAARCPGERLEDAVGLAPSMRAQGSRSSPPVTSAAS